MNTEYKQKRITMLMYWQIVMVNHIPLMKYVVAGIVSLR